MREPSVAEVMTRSIVTAVPDSSFREVVSALTRMGGGVVPVVDRVGRLVGVVTETDVLAKLEYHCGADLPPLLAGPRARARWRKASAMTAAELMTRPEIVICADAPVRSAVRALASGHYGQLCVVDHTHQLIGVVSRADVVRLFLRGDDDLKRDIELRLLDTSSDLTVRVDDGVVTLDGRLRLRSAVDHAGWAACTVPGVLTVHNNLSFEFDDLLITGL